MKVAEYKTYGPPQVVHITEHEKPVPQSDQVLIKIHATTVTAVDSIFRSGKQLFARMATGLSKPKSPVLGTEFAGEVESVGAGVTKFKPGDMVFGDSSEIASTHAQYICLPEDNPMVLILDNSTPEQAAAVPYGALTALPFLRDNGNINNGSKVLVVGASGGVGIFAVQLAKYFGAEVTGVCSTDNVELVQSLGADKVIDYKKEDFTASGQSWDIIFDTVGASSYSQCKSSLSSTGVYMTTVVSFSILWQMLWTSKSKGKKALVAFTGLRSKPERLKDLELVRDLLAGAKLRTVIDKTYPLEDIVNAYRYVDTGHKKGCVVIQVTN